MMHHMDIGVDGVTSNIISDFLSGVMITEIVLAYLRLTHPCTGVC